MSSRAGGLYGGIQFSSGSVFHSTVPEAPEQPKPLPNIIQVPVEQPAKPDQPKPVDVAQAAPPTGKPTAGISSYTIHFDS